MNPLLKEKVYLLYQWIKLPFKSLHDFKKILPYYFFLLLPFKKKNISNTFFHLPDFSTFKDLIKKSLSFDPNFFKRIIEPETLGLRLWEYSSLLSNTSVSNKKILDIGSGTSFFPFYLAQKKAKVTALDLKKPMETPYYRKYKNNPKFITGSVLKLPFKTETFDLVIAVSTLEHLDADYENNRPVTYRAFLERTKKALKEMSRVCKKKGLVYITTDFYLPQQKTDLWPTKIPYKNIGGAYKAKDLSLFLKTFSSLGLKPVSQPRFDFTKLKNSSLYSNYRGRYFTTANFLYQKPLPTSTTTPTTSSAG